MQMTINWLKCALVAWVNHATSKSKSNGSESAIIPHRNHLTQFSHNKYILCLLQIQLHENIINPFPISI